MLLGAVVIVVVGILVVNYFRNIESENTLPVAETEITDGVSLPTTHTVAEGEDLWKISEKYYESGYNWVDIAEANNLSNPGNITVGQELTIPSVSAKVIGDELASNETPTVTSTVTPTETTSQEDGLTDEEVEEDRLDSENAEESSEENIAGDISGETYTVVHGDSLWKIAERAYGDGDKWIDIAEANDLVNPSVIHAGNVFTLPR